MEARPEVVEEGVFDPGDFADELAEAPTNLEVGTTVWFENERIRVWEILLRPGERGAKGHPGRRALENGEGFEAPAKGYLP